METTTIPAGEAGRLRVSFNARGRKGRVQRKVTIHSNDPEKPSISLDVIAEVVPAENFSVEPPPPTKRTHEVKEELVFDRACLACHGPGKRHETGRKLYASACAACHGPSGAGWTLDGEIIGPSLQLPRMTVKSRAGVRQSIAAGTGHSAMPGFSKEYKGPLTDKQIDSLVTLILGQFPAP